jgi:hypothetical protein
VPFKTWDAYVTEAAIPDFELPVDDEQTIRVKAPTGEQVLAAARAQANGEDPEQLLRLMCGDAADDVLNLVMGAPYPVLSALAEDIMRHFGFDNEGNLPASSSS